MLHHLDLFKDKDFSTCFDANGGYLNAPRLYYTLFKEIPLLHELNQAVGEKVLKEVKEIYKNDIAGEFSSNYFNNQEKKYGFTDHFLILTEGRMIRFDHYYCVVLTPPAENMDFVNSIKNICQRHKPKAKRKAFEINLITQYTSGLGLTPIEINRTKLDISMNYEDDFLDIDQIIQKRLKKRNDKGIVLLHGMPGTGKTTYLRYLVGKLNKRVLFMPPSLAANMINPDFINILIQNPNSVLIIEDAENIIIDRGENHFSAVSNLLNIADGLLADCLNIQIICTFNVPLSRVDSALLRKGRLIAKYEFTKLSIQKAQRLSDSLGFKGEITEPMTITEIFNQEERGFMQKSRRLIGFNFQ